MPVLVVGGLLVGILVFVSGGVLRAAAGYGALAGGSGETRAEVLPVPAPPVAVAVGATVVVSWTAVTLGGGVPPDGYLVERLDSFGAPVAVSAGCDAVITGVTCTEEAVPAGSWSYRVRALLGAWVGQVSAAGPSITVAAGTLTWTTPMPVTSLPATLNGTISGFVVGESVTFHVDSPTGATLAASPGVVSSGAGQVVSVQLPIGIDDSPHSIVVVGSSGTIAAAPFGLAMPPALVSISMHDIDGNGRVDEVRATFDDTLAPYSAGTAPWTLTNVPSGGTLSAVSVAGNVATLTIAEGGGAPTTAVGSFRIALAADGSGVRDLNGHPSSFAARAPTDAAPPAPVTMVMQDSNGNGRVDRVAITWSERLAATTSDAAPWTLSNVPSGASAFTVTASGTTGRLTIAEGSGALDTGVGSMTVTLAASPGGPRDAAGNLSAFAPRAPTDGARPLLVTISDTSGATNGRIEPGDTLAATFTEPVATTSIPTSVTVTLTDPSGGGADRLTIVGLTNGARSLGANGYVSTNNVSYDFADSAVSYTDGGRTVIVTIGSTCAGTCTAIATQTTNANVSFSPAATITDEAGNLMRTTARTVSIRLF
jgi:hypothetical protein